MRIKKFQLIQKNTNHEAAKSSLMANEAAKSSLTEYLITGRHVDTEV